MEGNKMTGYNQGPKKNANSKKKIKGVQKKQSTVLTQTILTDQPEIVALEADSNQETKE